jgi:hypothetical protein
MGIVGALAAAIALALGAGPATAPVSTPAATARPAHPVVFGTEASNKRLAEVQAQRELDSVRVPPWVRPVAKAPASVLQEPQGLRGEPNLVQRWKWFVAPGTVSGTLRWFLRHPPHGSHTYDSLESPREAVESIWFEIDEHSRRVYGPSVIPIVARLFQGRVGIRLEVQQIWLTPHPAAAKVPAAVRFLYVSRRVGGEAPRWQLIRSVRRVRQVARVIDRLPADQPQVLYCPEVPRGETRVMVRMLFKAREGEPVLAEASESIPPYICESMTLKVAGESRTFGLEEGERAIALLHR